MSEKPRILVAEGNRAVASTLRKYLEGAGFAVDTAETQDDAVARLRNTAPAALLIGVSSLDGEALCVRAHEVVQNLPTVLVYPPEDDDPDERAAKAGADAYLIGPLKRGTVVSCLRNLFKVGELRGRVNELERDAEKRFSSPAAAALGSGAAKDADNIVEFEFFKRLLLLEVKRSKRYRYPNSFLLVAVDNFREAVGTLDRAAQGRFMGQLLSLVTKSVRDIDMCVLYAEDKFLVFLPHTPQPGAELVGNRLKDRIAAMEEGPKVTASIGIASYDGGGGNVSFGGLLKDAIGNLKKAQTEGGNRVEAGEQEKKPRDRVSFG